MASAEAELRSEACKARKLARVLDCLARLLFPLAQLGMSFMPLFTMSLTT